MLVLWCPWLHHPSPADTNAGADNANQRNSPDEVAVARHSQQANTEAQQAAIQPPWPSNALEPWSLAAVVSWAFLDRYQTYVEAEGLKSADTVLGHVKALKASLGSLQ